MAHPQTREHAHAPIDRIAPGQVSEAVQLLEKILDPVSLANAPLRMKRSATRKSKLSLALRPKRRYLLLTDCELVSRNWIFVLPKISLISAC
jgi:hypothetical protein